MGPKIAIAKCKYADVCYLSESLRCYGYQTHCILYKVSDGAEVSEGDFHAAMNGLIAKVRIK